jgi:hypothetical protein
MPDTGTSRPSHKAVLWIRWIARVLGSLIVAYWVIAGIASAIGDSTPWTWESTVIVVLIAASAVSFAVAWWREGIGGFLLLVCGVTFGGAPLVAVGMLFLGGWWGTRPR